jgi:hypothetical protein
VLKTVCGVFFASMTLARAYISDVTSVDTRAKRIGTMMGFFGLVC